MTASGNGPGRVGLSGDASLELRDGRWRLDGRIVLAALCRYVVTAARQPGWCDRRNGACRADRIARAGRCATSDQRRRDRGRHGEERRARGRHSRGRGAWRSELSKDVLVIHGASAPQFDAPLVQLDFSGRPLQPQLSFRVETPECRRRRSGAARCARRGPADGHASSISTSCPPANRQRRASSPAAARTTSARVAYTATLQGTQWMFAPTADQPLAGSLDLSFSGEGTVDEPTRYR